MNYFSHYLFDHQQNSPFYNLGLLFPDLYKTYTRNRIVPGNLSPQTKKQMDFVAGCKAHLERDKAFHAMPEFDTVCDKVVAHFRDFLPKLERDWFYAHVFVELMMDAYYLERFPKLGVQMYMDFEAISPQSLSQELNNLNLKGTEFNVRFQKFIEHKYVLSYVDNSQLLYAMGRVYESVCNEAIPQGFNDALLSDWHRFQQLIESFISDNNLVPQL